MRLARSCSVNGRRYAFAASRDVISCAHARRSAAAAGGRSLVVTFAGPAGWHEKIILRLGVSDTPVTFVGPVIITSITDGGSVVPALPVPFDARDHSCGLIRSSYGPSPRRTNAADTRC